MRIPGRELNFFLISAVAFVFIVAVGVSLQLGLPKIDLNDIARRYLPWAAGIAIGAVALALGTSGRKRRPKRKRTKSSGTWDDRPLVDKADDVLGYAPFAEHLAQSVVQLAPVDGFVIGLYGPWGVGKSTVINFFSSAIEHEAPGTVVLNFNPWWFAGEDDLLDRFMESLISEIAYSAQTDPRVRGWLANLAALVSSSPLPYGAFAGRLFDLLVGRKKTALELKEDITFALANSNQRVVVIIDDLDRLAGDEIRQVFRAIKAVADFPNILYVVAFDSTYVSRALSETPGLRAPGAADEYLEKIVQLPFNIPLPDQTGLRGMLTEKLDGMLAQVPNYRFEERRWQSVFSDGITHFLKTPRDVIRLVNSMLVSFSRPGVGMEVNFVDFVGIETLRVHSPDIHAMVSRNPTLFLEGNAPQIQLEIEGLLESMPSEKALAAKAILRHLFPVLRSTWIEPRIMASDDDAALLFSRARICVAQFFPRYFGLVLTTAMTETEIRTMIETAKDQRLFESRLVALANEKRGDGTSRAREFLDSLENYTDRDVPVEDIPNLVRALFNVGDELLIPADKRLGLLEWGNDVRIGRILHQLVRRLPQKARGDLLLEAVRDGAALSVIVHELAVFGQEQGRFGQRKESSPESWTVSSKSLDQLEKMAASKIRAAAKDGTLIAKPDLPNIMYRWRDWAGIRSPRAWAKKFTMDDEGFATFMAKYVGEGVYESGESVWKEPHLNPDHIRPFIDSEAAYQRAKKLINESWLTEHQRSALEVYIRDFDKVRAGDPVHDWRELDSH